MKFSALAAIAALTSAKLYRICDEGESYTRKCIPESLVGEWKARYTPEERTIEDRRGREVTRNVPVGTDAYTLEELGALDRACRKTTLAFDSYCHQYRFREDSDVEEDKVDIPKYADFRDDDGACAYDEDAARLQCEYQQCMFEYCLHRRDQWVAQCGEAVLAGARPEKRPGWGQVYSYKNMERALRDGSFENETCEAYVEELEY